VKFRNAPLELESLLKATFKDLRIRRRRNLKIHHVDFAEKHDNQILVVLLQAARSNTPSCNPLSEAPEHHMLLTAWQAAQVR
jgi:hypothetical protein